MDFVQRISDIHLQMYVIVIMRMTVFLVIIVITITTTMIKLDSVHLAPIRLLLVINIQIIVKGFVSMSLGMLA